MHSLWDPFLDGNYCDTIEGYAYAEQGRGDLWDKTGILFFHLIQYLHEVIERFLCVIHITINIFQNGYIDPASEK